MAQPPHTRAEMRVLYPVCQIAELAAGYRNTTLASAAGSVSRVPQFLLAPCRRTPGAAAAGVDQRDRLSQAVAALYASHGGGAHRSCVDPPGGAPVPRAAVAPASGGMSTPGW